MENIFSFSVLYLIRTIALTFFLFARTLSHHMSELQKISVCQNTTCQNRGSKSILYRLQRMYTDQYAETYPSLCIEAGECMGDCEQGPVLKINDAVLLRNVDNKKAEELLQNPQAVLGEALHVLQEDRETFDRLLNGELY